MAERKGGRPAPDTDSRVAGADWEGRELGPGDRFERVLYVDCDFTELRNSGAVFSECTFRNVKFNASWHRDAAFTFETGHSTANGALPSMRRGVRSID